MGRPTNAANEIGMEFKKHCEVPSKGAIMGIMGLQSLNFKRLTFKYGFRFLFIRFDPIGYIAFLSHGLKDMPLKFLFILSTIEPLLHMFSMHKGACSVADCSPTIK